MTFLAKGKSGCPVRPPETSTTPSIETGQLDTEIDIDGKYFCYKHLTIYYIYEIPIDIIITHIYHKIFLRYLSTFWVFHNKKCSIIYQCFLYVCEFCLHYVIYFLVI